MVKGNSHMLYYVKFDESMKICGGRNIKMQTHTAFRAIIDRL